MQNESRSSEARAPGDRFLEHWLRQSLAAGFNATLSERVPETLLSLLKEESRRG